MLPVFYLLYKRYPLFMKNNKVKIAFAKQL